MSCNRVGSRTVSFYLFAQKINHACAAVINRHDADRNLLFFTLGFSGTGGPLTSADIRETDFFGGRAGRLSSPAGVGTTLDSSPVSAPFSVGLETIMLLRLGGRAGEISPLKQNEEENTKLIGSNETLFLKYHTIKARKTFLIKQQILKANTTVRHLTQSAKKIQYYISIGD